MLGLRFSVVSLYELDVRRENVAWPRYKFESAVAASNSLGQRGDFACGGLDILRPFDPSTLRQAQDRQAQGRQAQDRQAQDRQAQDRQAQDRQAQHRQISKPLRSFEIQSDSLMNIVLRERTFYRESFLGF